MSLTTPTATQQQDISDASDAMENESPNRTKAALKSVMKTASKPQRVLAEMADDGSPTPVRVLRNGKKVRATPRLPKASRVELSPDDSKTLMGAHRVPFTQEGTHIQAAATAAVTALSVGSFAAEELLSEGSTTSPAALISRLQQLQLSSRDAKSPLQLADLPPNSSRGVCAISFSGTRVGTSSAATPVPSSAQDAESYPAPSAKIPEDVSAAVAEGLSVQTPTQAAAHEADERGAASVSTPELGAGAFAEEASMGTPVPAGVDIAEAAHESSSVPTPLPGPSPQLTGRLDFITPPPQILGDDDEAPESDGVQPTPQETPDEAFEEPLQPEATTEEEAAAAVSGYVSRSKRTPYMERKLKALQAKEWTDQDAGKLHRSRLEREKETAMAARRDSLSSTDRATTRRLVQSIFARVVSTQGKDLGETMVRHKSRLEREKDAAAAEKKPSPEASQGRQRSASAASSFAGQGLGDMKKHMSRLEKDRADVVAKRAVGVSSPAVQSRVPSYMRQTAASAAMQREGGLGENMKVHKSQLEKDRERALALQAARKKSGHNPLTPYPVKDWSAPKPRLSFGTLGGAPAHKSKLEKAKDAAAAAGPPFRPPKPAPSARAAAVPAAAGLGDMKPHKSRLEREKEAWERQASAQGSAKPAAAAAATKAAARQAGTSVTTPVTTARREGTPKKAKHAEGFKYIPN